MTRDQLCSVLQRQIAGGPLHGKYPRWAHSMDDTAPLNCWFRFHENKRHVQHISPI